MAAALEQETPGAEGGALPFDISQWLTDNKLGNYTEIFMKQQIDIEELLPLTKEELRTVAEDLGIKSIIHKNRFLKAVQKLVESSQSFANDNTNQNNDNNNNINNNKKSIAITKEEQDVLDKITLQIKKMTDLNNGNDYVIKNINIMSTKCENDINHLFDQFINSLKNRKKELITKTKQVTNNKLSIIKQQKSKINAYITELKQFQVSWTQLMLNQNNEPGQTIQQRKQIIISKSTQLLQKEKIIQNNMHIEAQNEININLTLTDKDRNNINTFISKIGYIHSNEPANSPIISMDKMNMTDITAQIIINFSNNSKLSLPQAYCLQIAETRINNQNKQEEEKKGEMNNEYEMKIDWSEIVTNGKINPNAIDKTKFMITNLKCNTKYMLQCKCYNKYGWSTWCECISFETKDKIFRMDSNILNENEKQIFCKSILMSRLGKHKNQLNVNLLYRASTDGFGADKFHFKCDGKKKTVVIIESNLGNVFGGYTKIGWSTDNKWHNDASCFLFLCRDLNQNNNVNMILKKDFVVYPIKQSYHSKAVKHYSAHGPCFGKGHDLLIVNAANITDSRSDGESFVNLKGNILTGSLTQIHNKYWHFVVRDYEVFQVL